MTTRHQHLRKSRLALGIAVICVIFGLESSVAHRVMPSPYSWLLWTVLSVVGVAALVGHFWFRHQSRRACD
jgi:peptidoglycan/LPS O-acetylase OafA/YrhL